MHYRVIVQDRGGILVDMEIEASDEGSVEGTLIGCLLGIEIIRVPVERRWSSDDGKTLLFQITEKIDETQKTLIEHQLRKKQLQKRIDDEERRHDKAMEIYRQFGKGTISRKDYDIECDNKGYKAKSQAWCKKHYP